MSLETQCRSPWLVMTTVGGTLAVLVSLVGGGAGWGYTCVYLVILGSGLPFGWAVAGRNHPGGWIAGSLLGYGLAATGFWVLAAAGWWEWWTCTLLVSLVCAISTLVWRTLPEPLVRLPRWRNTTTNTLAALLLLALVVMSVPYARMGEFDAEGYRRYRAYFTADFVWHEALTAELARGAVPPRNPYAANAPLAYYWTYFVVPATATRLVGPSPGAPVPIDTFLKVNGLWSGVLFISAVFLACWSAVPRALFAGLATGLTMVASSVEGLYAAHRTWRATESLAPLRELNVDAITMWWFNGLTFDGLPRSLWYNPQHSMACAFGLVALVIASRLRRTSSPAVAGAIVGVCLALGVGISPFPAGALSLVVAGRLAWEVAIRPRTWRRVLTVAGAASLPIAAGLWWCVTSGMVDGAGATVSIALSRRAMHDPVVVLGLAAGPILAAGAAALTWVAARRQLTTIAGSVLGSATALALFFFVTLDAEPIWVGWRAGQILMVTAPAALALLLVWIRRALPRLMLVTVIAAWTCIGLPTTVIDWYNAQDTSNLEMGPGFRWTVRISPAEQAAFDWIQRRTPATAIVQASLEPRGRETWSLIPSFARRRMAAGLPISLLSDAKTSAQAARADRIFQSTDAAYAWLLAREFDIDFLYLGHVEQRVFPDLINVLHSRSDLFRNVYANGEVSVFAVLCQVPAPCQ